LILTQRRRGAEAQRRKEWRDNERNEFFFIPFLSSLNYEMRFHERQQLVIYTSKPPAGVFSLSAACGGEGWGEVVPFTPFMDKEKIEGSIVLGDSCALRVSKVFALGGRDARAI
jgi:hypothetical protein